MALNPLQILATISLNATAAIQTLGHFGAAGVKAFGQVGAAALGMGRQVQQGANQANAATTQLSKSLENTGRSIRSAGVSLTVGFSAPLAAFAINASKVASNANEMRNRLKLLFGESTADIQQWSQQQAIALNRSAIVLQGQASLFQAFFIKTEKTTEAAAEMSKQFVLNAQDLASFWDVTEDEALSALRSALAGEIEPLRRWGIVLSDNALRTKALAMGFTAVNGAFTDNERLAARVALIQEQMGAATGDAARTAGVFANQIKGLTGAWLDMNAAIGDNINAILLPFITVAKDAMYSISQMPEGVQQVVAWFSVLGSTIGPLVTIIGSFAMNLGFMIFGFEKAGPWIGKFVVWLGRLLPLVIALSPAFLVLAAGIGTLVHLTGGWEPLIGKVIKGLVVIADWGNRIGVISVSEKTLQSWWDWAAGIEKVETATEEATKATDQQAKKSDIAASKMVGYQRVIDEAVKRTGGIVKAATPAEKAVSKLGNEQLDVLRGSLDEVITKNYQIIETTNQATEAYGRLNEARKNYRMIETESTPPPTERRAGGGMIGGRGGVDNVPAWLSRGEFVHRTAAVRKYGVRFMRMINSLSLPRDFALAFAEGGLVPGVRGLSMTRASSAGGGGSSFTLVIDGQTFADLRAPADTASDLMRFARERQMRQVGKPPPWFK